MKRSVRIAAGLGLAVSMLASASQATTVKVTFTGTATGGDNGFFGTSGAVVGDPFEAVYTLSDVGGPASVLAFGSPPLDSGLQTYNASESLTINNHTVTIPAASPSDYLLQPYLWETTLAYGFGDVEAGVEQISASATLTGEYSMLTVVQSGLHDIVADADYHVPFSYTAQAGDDVTGSFSFQVIDNTTGATLKSAVGQLYVTSVSLAAVPEPTTWALLLIGVGGIGAMARLRRELASAA